MFDSDRPIQLSSQDRLDRSVFAKYLTRCLLDNQDSGSLVVGLYGGWGVGKTSIINLVIEEIAFSSSYIEENDKPIVLNFSPWSYSGQHQLVYSFFRRLSSVLRNEPLLENADLIIDLLELYVSYFTQKSTPTSLRVRPSLLRQLTSKDREALAWESGRDLTSVKSELNDILRRQKRKIIIIIDNISRLYDYEIKQIFQIVKSMGDFANTTYLLSFDKDQVINALNRIEHGGAAAYIEKVIQLPFEVPPILQHDVEGIFADKMTAIVHSVPEGAWNIEYWADIYYHSLKYFFENCRDITRYVNTLDFGYQRLRDVVNPVDFFALTAIEVFIPEVYAAIRENKDLFTDLLDNVYRLNDNEIQQDKNRCEGILSKNQRVSRDVLLELIMGIFPRIRHIYYPEIHFYYSDAIARKLKRIASPDIFDTYFLVSLQSNHISKSEFTSLIALSHDATAFEHAITRLNQDHRILQFLELLDNKILSTIAIENIQSMVNALFQDGDFFPADHPGPLSLDTATRIHRIIRALLLRFGTSEERFIILQNAIANTSKSLYILVHELKELSREHQAEADTYLPAKFQIITPDQVYSLKKLVVSRIKIWAHNGSLKDHPRLLDLLYAWMNWGDEETCRKQIEAMTNSDQGLLAFLTAILATAISQAMTKYEKNISWEAYLNDINSLIPASSLEQHAKILFEDNYFEKLREKEQLALMIFLDILKTPTNKVIPNTTV